MREAIIQPAPYLENLVAGLEKGAVGLAFASGLAAIDAVLKLLESRRRNDCRG